MNSPIKTKSLFLLLLGGSLSLQAQIPFSLDSATAYLKTISVEIGPRSMGSPDEMRAMEFALAKFREFGFSDAYLMPMNVAGGEALSRRVNTRSGIAVGVLKGKTDRIIVLGAHIDSALPEIPGTNDDGSGSATIIELARVLSQKRHESTIVFCLFCGEEQGLRGSRYFVDNFPNLQKVVLMIQIDMANGSDWILPLLDTRTHSAPQWLVEAAYEEFSRLGYSGLAYPTHFMTLNNALLGGGIGSDHQPFLENNIPAIDFTSDVTDPIHTPQDNFGNFKTSGLKRSGDLVYNLVERFDKGVPVEKNGKYFLKQIGSVPYFLSYSDLYLFIVATLTLTIIALITVRKRRTEIEKAERRKIPALKLLLLMIIIQACVWISENFVGWIKGDRFPWFRDPGGYYLLASLAGLIGIWLALNLGARLKLSTDPYRWFLRTVVVLVAFFALSLFGGLKLAVYPVFALFFLSLALLIRIPILQLFFWTVSPYLMYRLVFSECINLLSRSLVLFGYPIDLGPSLLIHLAYVLFFSVYAFPFLLGFAAVYSDSKTDLLWLRAFREPTGIALSGSVFVLTAVWLVTQPSYSTLWRQNITVEQHMNVSTGVGSISIRSPEFLKGARIHSPTYDTTITSNVHLVKFTKPMTLDKTWISVERDVKASKDSVTNYDVSLRLRLKHRPYTLRVAYSTPVGRIRNCSTPFATNVSERSVSINWYSFPDTLIVIPLHLVVSGTDTLTQSIEAVFVEQAQPVEIAKELTNVISRTTVTTTDKFSGGSTK